MSVVSRLRATSEAVSESMRPVRPLDLPQVPSRLPRRARMARRWPSWLIPLTAAAAVLAVAVALVVVRDIPAGRPSAKAPRAVTSSGAVAVPADPEAVPSYWVALRNSVVVGDTRTGSLLATIAPPAHYAFGGVTGAADDRTFVVDAWALGGNTPIELKSRSWYLLRIAPGTAHPAELTSLAIPATPDNAQIDGIALSPDGTKLAVMYQPNSGSSSPGPVKLLIYAVPAGTLLRSWAGPAPRPGSNDSWSFGFFPGADNNTTLSWTTRGRTLAFAWRTADGPGLYLRLLDLTRPGHDLLADSRVVVSIADKGHIYCQSLAITGQGRTAVCGADLPRALPAGVTLDKVLRPGPWLGCPAPTDAVEPGFAELSTVTGKVTRVVYQVKGLCVGGGSASVLWASPSGNTILGMIVYTTGKTMQPHRIVVLVSHGTTTPIAFPGAAKILLPGAVAF